jgi:protein-tyrosine-phosphatase
MEYASMDPTQLSQEDIDWADEIVFMSPSNLNYVENNLEPDGTTFQVWDIPDADPEDPLRETYKYICNRLENTNWRS